MKDRFDLEQHIMECWNVTSDIDMLLESILDSPRFADMPADYSDRIANMLLGTKELYEMRFERLWSTFEECIGANQFNNYKEEYEDNENIGKTQTNYVQETNKRSVEDAWSIHNDLVTGDFSTGSDHGAEVVTVPQKSYEHQLSFNYEYEPSEYTNTEWTRWYPKPL